MPDTVMVAPTDQMPNIHIVLLQGQVPGGEGIEILRAEMRLDIGSPLAMIRYAEEGREPQYGLRLDIDKRVFVDHLNNEAQEHVLQLAAPKIAAMLGVELQVMRYRDFTKETILSSATATTDVSKTNINRNVNAQGESVMLVIKENLSASKREVQSGGVRVYSHVTETPAQTSVNLRKEHVTVDRRPVDRPVDANTLNALREGVIEVTETSEIPVLAKEARIIEEVVVGKEAT